MFLLSPLGSYLHNTLALQSALRKPLQILGAKPLRRIVIYYLITPREAFSCKEMLTIALN